MSRKALTSTSKSQNSFKTNKSSPLKVTKKHHSNNFSPLKIDIFKQYNQLKLSPTRYDSSYGVTIDDLWKETKRVRPDLDFRTFELTLLDLIHKHIEDVSPSQGISFFEEQKVIHDKYGTKRYFHYVKFSGNLITSALPDEKEKPKRKIYWDGKRRIRKTDHQIAITLMSEDNKKVYDQETPNGKLKIVKWVLAINSIPEDWRFKWRVRPVQETAISYHLQFEKYNPETSEIFGYPCYNWLHYENTLKWMKTYLS